MILRKRYGISLFCGLFLQLALLVALASAKKDSPRIASVKLDQAPAAPPFYFEDSDVILIHDVLGNVLRSENAGETWDRIADVPERQGFELFLHPYDKKVAYLWGKEKTHWVTEDRGESWRSFELEAYLVRYRMPFSFHANDPAKVVVNVCTGLIACNEMAWYTTDAFKSPPKELRKDTRSCVFAKSTEQFRTSEDDEHDERVICVVKGRYSSPWIKKRDNELRVSDNYFEDEEEPLLEGDRTVQGIINIAVVKGCLVAAASAKGTDELAMYVTDDAKTWHRAVFPSDHRIEEDAYTLLESTNYSIQVDVMTTTPLNAMGVLFTSNSNGTYFTRNIEHTNRNHKGIVDFEKITGIQGIVLVNVVDNWKEVEKSVFAKKKIKSKISFDDGRTFSPLTVDGDELHLHSVSDMSNSGKVFSSPAPGLVMGIGNKGEYLKDYDECDVYVSDHAGTTWTRALKEAHKYEFGDKGAVLVAIYDEGPTNEISYSLNHGHKWKTVKLEDKVRAKILTTTPDSTSLKFFLMATKGGGEDLQHYAISIDFADLHEDKCKEDDFEKWYARVDEDGEPSCIMGHKQWYRRRKWDADCFVDEEFKDPKPEFEPCACTKADFECDTNFIPSDDGEKCKPASFLSPPPGQCKDGKETFKASSGYRLIPGNDCDRKADGAVELDGEIERPCTETQKPPVSGEISKDLNQFSAGRFEEYFYLERSDQSQKEDETIVMRTDEHEVYMTKDAGKKWDRVLEDEEITAIYPHQYFNDVVFFLTPGKKVFYSVNRLDSIKSFEAPADPTRDRLQILSFHANYKDWLLWTGAVDCGSSKEGECHNVAYFSEDRGVNWLHQVRYVNKCEFIKEEGRGGVEKLVYCEQYEDEELSGRLQLKWSDNWFADDHKEFDDIIDFATMSEFIVVAARKEDDREALTCHTSMDGKTFANAQFPPSLEVPREKAYTVLDSSTHAVFLHVTVNNKDGSEYGSIIKSNSNGTSYVMSLNGVNRNRRGYVDFEKMLGLEGVILVNQVANIDEVDKGASKKLKTMITHNDGAQWATIRAPENDAEGRKFECDTSNPKFCSLHLHSYTERRDPRATFSSPSAIGLMMGVGNVGEYLGRKGEADTFITRDGGVEWHSVMKGNYMWEYGDQGSIIVIVKEDTAIRSVFYTLNEGIDWIEYPFSDTDFTVGAISTVPSDKSRNFILWGKESTSDSKIATVNLDFTGLTDRRCDLSEKDPEAGDYYLWEPKHPSQKDNCLFGHVAQYHRKKLDSDCYNGLEIKHLHNIARNCSCTREDFECDYNYQIANDGSCQLVPGLSEPDHSQACRDNPSLKSYYKPTGYRRTPLDTCTGGKELEYTSEAVPCPGWKPEFDEDQRKKGLSGFPFFLVVILLPICIAAGVGYWVWRNWDGKFGQIRLGGETGGSAFDADKPWIAWPVMAVSGVVAVVATLPLLAGSAWRGVRGMFGGGGRRYTTRSDFARGGRYAVVDPDEDELLGDDEEDEV
ncbi:vacuolar protein sorting/targeting protein PEP1 [Lecanora helva]